MYVRVCVSRHCTNSLWRTPIPSYATVQHDVPEDTICRGVRDNFRQLRASGSPCLVGNASPRSSTSGEFNRRSADIDSGKTAFLGENLIQEVFSVISARTLDTSTVASHARRATRRRENRHAHDAPDATVGRSGQQRRSGSTRDVRAQPSALTAASQQARRATHSWVPELELGSIGRSKV